MTKVVKLAKTAKSSNNLSKIIENAFDQSAYAINIMDLDGRLLKANEAYLKLYGYRTESEVIGKTQQIINSPRTPKVIFENIWKHLEAGKTWSGEMTNHTRDGKEVFIHLTINPISKNGKKIGYMGFCIDRSQQVIMEKQLLHANKLVVLGTLGAGLAHEINNPLTSISLEAEYIQETIDRLNDMPEAKKLKSLSDASKNILRGVERMNKVIKHLRIYSRKEDPMNIEKISIKNLIDDSFLFLDKQLKNHGIEVTVNIPEDLKILGRRMDLESVIHNLLTNSRDAFRSRNKAVQNIWIEVSRTEENWMLLDYMDNAGGISHQIIDSIFDPFFTTKAEGEGTGLGLAIAKKIIVEFGGLITCESSDGRTRFLIRMPLAKSGDCYGTCMEQNTNADYIK